MAYTIVICSFSFFSRKLCVTLCFVRAQISHTVRIIIKSYIRFNFEVALSSVVSDF
jgi:hypothetical protein